MLGCRFSLEEVNEAVFSSYTDGAPRPDGIFFSSIRSIRSL
jgi:hypothetical protein